ncbi:MAG: nucleotidyltransferase domain-containing protein [bacterium]|nr:nucleotidyltransferase domain-containing protein [bacterium]
MIRTTKAEKKITDIDNQMLQRLVQYLVQAIQPEKIILFGSRAKGTAGFDSDIDLFIQVETGRNTREITRKTYRVLRNFPDRPEIGIDVVVKDRAFVERYGDLVGTIVHPVLREGKVLYAR